MSLIHSLIAHFSVFKKPNDSISNNPTLLLIHIHFTKSLCFTKAPPASNTISTPSMHLWGHKVRPPAQVRPATMIQGQLVSLQLTRWLTVVKWRVFRAVDRIKEQTLVSTSCCQDPEYWLKSTNAMKLELHLCTFYYKWFHHTDYILIFFKVISKCLDIFWLNRS